MPSLVGSEMCIRDSLVTLDALYLKFEKTKKYAALSKSQQDKLSYAWARLEPLRYKKISEITLEDMQRTIDEKVSTFYPARDMKTMLSHLYTSVSYTHLRAHETRHDLVCRLLLEKKKTRD